MLAVHRGDRAASKVSQQQRGLEAPVLGEVFGELESVAEAESRQFLSHQFGTRLYEQVTGLVCWLHFPEFESRAEVNEDVGEMAVLDPIQQVVSTPK